MSPRSVVVVGAGVAGLAAARQLAGAGHDVVILEAEQQPGGKLRTGRIGGLPVDLGPDVFVTRDPSALELAIELGLEKELIAPTATGAAIFARGALRRWPEGLVLGVPTSLRGLRRSQVLSRRGALRAAVGLATPARRLPRDLADPEAGADPSVADALGRIGGEAIDTLVDPVLGGINAGDVRRLSLASTAPALAGRIAGRRSLWMGLRGGGKAARAGASASTAPMFLGLAEGMGRLAGRLVEDAIERGCDLRLCSPVVAIGRGQRMGGPAEANWILSGEGWRLDSDGLILAVPAFAAGALLADVDAELAGDCNLLSYADVATVTFAWPDSAVPAATTAALAPQAGARPDAGTRLPGNGVLVPRRSGNLTTALTFVSTKWPRSAPPGQVVVRASAGRHGDERASRLGDAELAEAIRREIELLLGIKAAPSEVVVQRWPRSFPQFESGYAARLSRIGARAARLPPLALAGAGFGGIGIPACVASGHRAADQVQRSLQLAGAAS